MFFNVYTFPASVARKYLQNQFIFGMTIIGKQIIFLSVWINEGLNMKSCEFNVQHVRDKYPSHRLFGEMILY